MKIINPKIAPNPPRQTVAQRFVTALAAATARRIFDQQKRRIRGRTPS